MVMCVKHTCPQNQCLLSNLSMGKTKELLRDGKDKVVDLHLVWDWSCERLQMIPKLIMWIVKELKAIRTTVPMHTIDNTLHYTEQKSCEGPLAQ